MTTTSYFTMTRKGSFNSADPSNPNQCKEIGTSRFYYNLVMVFDGSLCLDNRGFIIDHQKIDDDIQSLALTGSCEIMLKSIAAHIVDFFQSLGLPCVALKAQIIPEPSEGDNAPVQAWMTRIVCSDHGALPLLQSAAA